MKYMVPDRPTDQKTDNVPYRLCRAVWGQLKKNTVHGQKSLRTKHNFFRCFAPNPNLFFLLIRFTDEFRKKATPGTLFVVVAKEVWAGWPMYQYNPKGLSSSILTLGRHFFEDVELNCE